MPELLDLQELRLARLARARRRQAQIRFAFVALTIIGGIAWWSWTLLTSG